jgi:hypothetical protein
MLEESAKNAPVEKKEHGPRDFCVSRPETSAHQLPRAISRRSINRDLLPIDQNFMKQNDDDNSTFQEDKDNSRPGETR